MSHVRAIVRLILFASWLLSLFSVWFILSIPLSVKPRWAIAWRYFAIRRWSILASKIMGLRMHVRGTPPERPFCLVSNHLSYLDAVLMQLTTESVIIAKSEVASWPVIGWLSERLGTIFVDRSTAKDLVRVNELIETALDRREGIIFFPEGTTTTGEGVGRFHSSLLNYPAESSYPVHYAALSYLAPGHNTSNVICWWDDIGFAPHFYNVLRLPGFDAYIHFAETPVTEPNRKELSNQLQSRIAELFVPVGNRLF